MTSLHGNEINSGDWHLSGTNALCVREFGSRSGCRKRDVQCISTGLHQEGHPAPKTYPALELYTKTACQKSRGQPTNPGVPGKMASKMMCDVKKIVMSYTGVTWISMYL